MKAIIVTPYFYPRIGGLENYAYNISKILFKKYGVDIIVVCANWEHDAYKEENIEGLRIYRLPYLFKVSSTPINPQWRTIIKSIIKREKPDIINGHLPVPYIADISARIARRNNIPFLLTYHNDLYGRNPLLKLLSALYYSIQGNNTLSMAEKIIVTSEHYATRSRYLNRYKTKIETVPVGVDTNRFFMTPKTIDAQKYNILFVGQLNSASRHKGLDDLLRATTIVNKYMPDTQLTVIGKGDYLKYYKRLAEKLGIIHKIIFTGFISDEKLPDYYRQSNLLVLPSVSTAEGFGIVLIEAQACGIPVIGTNVGGIPSAIKNNETGLLVPPHKSDALAKAILKILGNKELALNMGLNGYNRIKKDFSWEKSAEKTYTIYQKTITK